MVLMITTLGNALGMLDHPVLIVTIFVGVIWGIVGGALPGVGPSLTLGIALPSPSAWTLSRP
jgi:TctA family transporter